MSVDFRGARGKMPKQASDNRQSFLQSVKREAGRQYSYNVTAPAQVPVSFNSDFFP